MRWHVGGNDERAPPSFAHSRLLRIYLLLLRNACIAPVRVRRLCRLPWRGPSQYAVAVCRGGTGGTARALDTRDGRRYDVERGAWACVRSREGSRVPIEKRCITINRISHSLSSLIHGLCRTYIYTLPIGIAPASSHHDAACSPRGDVLHLVRGVVVGWVVDLHGRPLPQVNGPAASHAEVKEPCLLAAVGAMVVSLNHDSTPVHTRVRTWD